MVVMWLGYVPRSRSWRAQWQYPSLNYYRCASSCVLREPSTIYIAIAHFRACLHCHMVMLHRYVLSHSEEETFQVASWAAPDSFVTAGRWSGGALPVAGVLLHSTLGLCV